MTSQLDDVRVCRRDVADPALRDVRRVMIVHSQEADL